MSAISTTVYALQERRVGWIDLNTYDTQAEAEANLYTLLEYAPEGSYNGRLRVVERTTTITQTNVLNVRGVGE